MKVVIDRDRCEGNARCVATAPRVFELGEDDVSRLRVSDIPADQQEYVEHAIRLCPRQAISLAPE